MIWKCIDDEALMAEAEQQVKFRASQPTKGLGNKRKAKFSGQ
jgi:hypothetical protein